MRRSSVYITGSLIIGVIVGLIIAASFDFSPPAETQSTGTLATAGVGGFQDAVVNVAKTTGRAVDSISTQRTQRFGGTRRYQYSAPFKNFFGDDDVFRRFFDDFFGDFPEREYRSKKFY